LAWRRARLPRGYPCTQPRGSRARRRTLLNEGWILRLDSELDLITRNFEERI